MKKKIRLDHRASFRFGSQSKTHLEYYSFNEFDTLPEKAGWYCWFYVPMSYEQVNLNFFTHANLDVCAKSIFGVQYEGELKLRERDKAPEMTPEQFKQLQSTIISFSPPLYIGIATDLRSRLNTHKRQLEALFQTGNLQREISIGEDELDSDAESSYFASRIAKEMVANNIDMAELCIKCVYADDSNELRAVESVVNKMFVPPYGRR